MPEFLFQRQRFHLKVYIVGNQKMTHAVAGDVNDTCVFESKKFYNLGQKNISVLFFTNAA